MATNIIGDTEWNGLPMPRRLGAIVAVAFGVSLSVIDSVIANVALADSGFRIRDLVGKFCLDRQCLSAGSDNDTSHILESG